MVFYKNGRLECCTVKEEVAGEPNVDGDGANPQVPSQSSTAVQLIDSPSYYVTTCQQQDCTKVHFPVSGLCIEEDPMIQWRGCCRKVDAIGGDVEKPFATTQHWAVRGPKGVG